MTPKDPAPRSAAQDDAGRAFVVVGVGASAGGLAALEALFGALPDDGSGSALAFVVVQHLDPDHESMLLDLVGRFTHLGSAWAEDGMRVEPGHVYLMPRNSEMDLLDGKLRITEPLTPRGLRLPIDHFLRSLAKDVGERAAAIILSGTGSDGTAGVRAIKGEGGIVIAQSPESSGYDGMPRSVISAGLADYVLEPAKMPEQLLDYTTRAFGNVVASEPEPQASDVLAQIMITLRDQTGHDFSQYKTTTIRRRVERRMALLRVSRLSDYLSVVQRDPVEAETLFRELLIGVTSFFRDKEAFRALDEKVIRPLAASKKSGDSIRVWIPGCSTGEEACSIAILLQAAVAETGRRIAVQVFATDIDPSAIQRARTGEYPDSIGVDIPPEHLERFFVASSGGYRIIESVRSTLVFAEQDVTKDPPFSRVDLISCRNLLIYLESGLQRRLMPVFHYAINPGGFLFLGSSETVGDAHGAFRAVDKKWRIYERIGQLPDAGPVSLAPAHASRGSRLTRGAHDGAAPPVRESLRVIVERALLGRHTPAAVLIDAGGDVLYVHGRTGQYLEPAAGEATSNLLKMAREGIRFELTSGVRKALTDQATVCYENLRVTAEGRTMPVNLTIEPLPGTKDRQVLLLVVFEATPLAAIGSSDAVATGAVDVEQRIADLDRELSAKEEYLRAAIEELETSNEELKSTNEELQSSNEELQSTIEELETSKEELQSVNEELVTVNSELQQKLEQLSTANSDMNNLLAGTGIGTLFVGQDLRIQRFTPAATDIVNLIKSDIGRPLGDIASRLKNSPNIVALVRDVLDTLVSTQAEVEAESGRAYLMRIQPYRTLDNVIEGAVVSFIDETEQRDLRRELERLAVVADKARDFAEAVSDAVREPLVVVDDDMVVVSTNSAFRALVGVEADSIDGRPLASLGEPWSTPDISGFVREASAGADTTRVFADRPLAEEGINALRLSARQLPLRSGERLFVVTVSGGA